MYSFNEQIQIEETTDKMFDFMAEILSTCYEEEVKKIFNPIKNLN